MGGTGGVALAGAGAAAPNTEQHEANNARQVFRITPAQSNPVAGQCAACSALLRSKLSQVRITTVCHQAAHRRTEGQLATVDKRSLQTKTRPSVIYVLEFSREVAILLRMRMSLLETYSTVDKQPEQTQVGAVVAGELATTDAFTVAASVDCTPERNPFHVYLARLAKGSRPTMAEALERIARIASGGTLEAAAFPWHLLRYQHVTAVRTALMESISERTGQAARPGDSQQGSQCPAWCTEGGLATRAHERRGPGQGHGLRTGAGLDGAAG